MKKNLILFLLSIIMLQGCFSDQTKQFKNELKQAKEKYERYKKVIDRLPTIKADIIKIKKELAEVNATFEQLKLKHPNEYQEWLKVKRSHY